MVEMSSRFPELDQIRLSVAENVRDRHLAAIDDAIRSAKAPRLRRFRLLVVAAALILALPVMALASDDAVPGDLLYPIKIMLEPVVSLVDPDVEVDHRVREAEGLLDRGAEPAVIRDRVERARIVVTKEHPGHVARLDLIVDRLQRPPDDGGGSPVAPDISDEGASEPEPQDRVREHRQREAEPSDAPVESVDETHDTTTTTADDGTTRPTDGRRDG